MSCNLTQVKTTRIQAVIELSRELQGEANLKETRKEHDYISEIAKIIEHPDSKLLLTEIADQAFRSYSAKRSVNQVRYLMSKHQSPIFLNVFQRFGIKIFQRWGWIFPQFWMFLLNKIVRKKTAHVIVSAEKKAFARHLSQRTGEGIRLNINHLGEAILGETEARNRLETYLEDLRNPEIECVSVKISTLYSQIQTLDWGNTLNILRERYQKLLIASKEHFFIRSSGEKVPKIVNLDMEEYRDLKLTVELFQVTLSDPLCKDITAGIVLQSYLPDSFSYLEELTTFAMKRISEGGAPIKIRLVKGANLAMEKVEASIRGWPQAPFSTKAETDANYLKMLDYALDPERSAAVRIGVGSHNIFDIAYAWLIAKEKKVEEALVMEMLEGMAEPIRRVVQERMKNVLLYCPVTKKEEFHSAIAYLIRRLDENTGKDNFLRVAFDLKPGSEAWNREEGRFLTAYEGMGHVHELPYRIQDRTKNQKLETSFEFHNTPDTDWSLPSNVLWGQEIIKNWKAKEPFLIPLIVGGREELSIPKGIGRDPSRPGEISYLYQAAEERHVEEVMQSALKAFHYWKDSPITEREALLEQIAFKLHEGREHLMGSSLRDVGKTLYESDPEVSEAIDFALYYRHSLRKLFMLPGVALQAKGVVLVASPWNFPCSIPIGGIVAALAAGNSVIFKPAPEAVLVGYQIVQLFYEAGVPKDLLQFFPASDQVASQLVKDPRLATVILTGSNATAKHLYQLHPGIDLVAETGGKNSMIITALADRDLAVRDLVQSAFGYSGQKCSACSVAILEAEVFDDPQFQKQLKDAVLSLAVGSAYEPSTKVTPLIRPPEGPLAEAILSGKWLVVPRVDGHNPQLVNPGVLWGDQIGSYTHQHELFGPILSVIRARDLSHALEIANATPYGLTAGLHSLDEREHAVFLEKIKAGNCYINRGITGAVVERQPFGGTKKSSFGPGFKAGGPNYLFNLLHVEQTNVPEERMALPSSCRDIMEKLKMAGITPDEYYDVQISAESYWFHWKNYFSKTHEAKKLLGQSNILKYVPHDLIIARILPEDSLVDVSRIYFAARISQTPLKISLHPDAAARFEKTPFMPVVESDEQFLSHIRKGRIRLLSMPEIQVIHGLSVREAWQMPKPALANGRIELLNYMREVSISYDYHRYGNLGARFNE